MVRNSLKRALWLKKQTENFPQKSTINKFLQNFIFFYVLNSYLRTFFLKLSCFTIYSKYFLSWFLTWSSLSNPGALQYPPSPAHGDGGSVPPPACSQKEGALPSSPCSSAHEPPDTENGSGVQPDADTGPILCLLGLEESSGARIGSGGLEGGGELVGNGGSSETRGSGGSLKRKAKYSFV